MPWGMYSKMKPEDLAAIFAYPLKSIKHAVAKFEPAAK
jgi:hypothetical protein